MSDPFRYFNSSPEVIRLVVMMYVKYPLSLRNVEDGDVYRVRELLRLEVIEFLISASWSQFFRVWRSFLAGRQSCVTNELN